MMTEHEKHIHNVDLVRKLFRSMIMNSSVMANNMADQNVANVMEDFYKYILAELEGSLKYAVERLEQVS